MGWCRVRSDGHLPIDAERKVAENSVGEREFFMANCFSLLADCMLFSGCAAIAPFTSLLSTPTGPPPLQVHEQTSVKLAEGNFTLVKTNVTGRSKGFSLLGIITMYPATLTKAMNHLCATAQMREGEPQTVAHLVIEQSTTYWLLFGIPEINVRADIVQFNHETNKAEQPQSKPPDLSP
jgi:hypothetical protein